MMEMESRGCKGGMDPELLEVEQKTTEASV